jgi:hypothetical protein
MADPLHSVERYRWLAKLWAARADWTRASEMLRRGHAVPRIAGTEAQANLLVVEAEMQLRQLQTASAMRMLDQAERIAADGAGTRWSAMLDVTSLRSVAKAQAGEWADALRLAQAAVAGASQALGEQHPRTARARVHLVWLWLRHPRRDQAAVDAGRELELALPVLRRCYAPSSDPVHLAEALIEVTRGVQGVALSGEPSPARRLTNDPRAFVL